MPTRKRPPCQGCPVGASLKQPAVCWKPPDGAHHQHPQGTPETLPQHGITETLLRGEGKGSFCEVTHLGVPMCCQQRVGVTCQDFSEWPPRLSAHRRAGGGAGWVWGAVVWTEGSESLLEPRSWSRQQAERGLGAGAWPGALTVELQP